MKNNVEEENKKYLLDHEYDGIKECDYPLPTWWLMTFYGAILYSIGYFVFYTYMDGKTLREEYRISLGKYQTLQERYLEKISEFDNEKFKSIYGSNELVSYGKEIFDINCKSCHNTEGIGDIGPNLSDQYWLYAEGTPETIYQFVLEGNPEGGMPSWHDKLEEDDLYSLIAYIMKIQGKKHKKKKEPQGEEYPLWSPNVTKKIIEEMDSFAKK